ncbi:MAG: hypothetical protein K0A94_08200 [Desulfuromonadales bacterium]|nr:hypothetical protein [Desulfuromonadales bacterium]
MAGLSEAKTLAELSSEYGVHPTQITRWKQELIISAPDLFGEVKKKDDNHKAEVAELHRQIYGEEVELLIDTMAAFNRYSNRV